MTRYSIVTWHGEHETLWYVVDPQKEDQPAVIATLSSRAMTRQDVQRLLQDLTKRTGADRLEREEQDESPSAEAGSSSV